MKKNNSEGRIVLMSFGFKYGLPNANYYFDVGFAKNPAREKKWSFFSEPDVEMKKFVVNQEKVQKFLSLVEPLIVFLSTIDQDQRIAFGCNSGRHRSNIIVEELAERLKSKYDLYIEVYHRDADKRNKNTF